MKINKPDTDLQTEKLKQDVVNDIIENQKEQIESKSISFKLQVNIAIDEEKQPLNSASKEWETDENSKEKGASSWVGIGRLTIPKQETGLSKISIKTPDNPPVV